jgi:8-oxo-dGTP diphosphatase
MTVVEYTYGNKVRVRVCGVLKHQDKVLLINHSSLNKENTFWHFPGGGLEHNEDIHSSLKREFLEETKLEIIIHDFLHMNQFIEGSLHAIELFFRVSSFNLKPDLGCDPELNILTDIRWFTQNELEKLPPSHRPNFIKDIAFNTNEQLL